MMKRDLGSADIFLKKNLFLLLMISCFTNLFSLIAPVYMMQIYDRIIVSQSIETLFFLFVLILLLYVFYGFVEYFKKQILSRVVSILEAIASPQILKLSFFCKTSSDQKISSYNPIESFQRVRNFLSSPGPLVILDLPWLPFYMILIAIIQPILGLIATIGCFLIIYIIVLSTRLTRVPSIELDKHGTKQRQFIRTFERNLDSVAAMGLSEIMSKRWLDLKLEQQTETKSYDDADAFLRALVKSARFILQATILTVGAYQVIKNNMSAGSIIACAILINRALAPVDRITNHWSRYLTARKSWQSLVHLEVDLKNSSKQKPTNSVSKHSVAFKNVSIKAKKGNSDLLTNINFTVEKSSFIAIVGESGVGKSTLAKTLVGTIPPSEGEILIDENSISNFSDEQKSTYIGYLSQDTCLFQGTIRQNVGRFNDIIDGKSVEQVCNATNALEFINQLPQSFETIVGSEEFQLSGGQCQRICLARAFYGSPFLVVLDEPDANLHENDVKCLMQYIQDLKESGSIIFMITHNPALTASADYILHLHHNEVEVTLSDIAKKHA